eukprot:TRINITY_DN59598_c0_g1_i1.p1 TRINITY_DN59598_c0_g1~~TRINITY_DN59598_c0_g1_i1.p1  ORF type:complete len:1287 (-),score=257.26 TRINITY_DN59598_c0_g1_i1:111-3971(-)
MADEGLSLQAADDAQTDTAVAPAISAALASMSAVDSELKDEDTATPDKAAQATPVPCPEATGQIRLPPAGDQTLFARVEAAMKKLCASSSGGSLLGQLSGVAGNILAGKTKTEPASVSIDVSQLPELLFKVGLVPNEEEMENLINEVSGEFEGRALSAEQACSVCFRAQQHLTTGRDREAHVVVFVNPSSGGGKAGDWLQLASTTIVEGTEADEDASCRSSRLSPTNLNVLPSTPTHVHIHSLPSKQPKGQHGGFLHLKRLVDEAKTTGRRPTVVIAGGDGTVNWVLTELAQHELPAEAVEFAVVAYGTGNDLSRVLGWGAAQTDSGFLTPAGLRAFVTKWRCASVASLDVWSLYVHTKPAGGFQVVQRDGSLSLSAADAARMNVKSHADGCHAMSRLFVNYFSMGVLSQMGIAFDKQRSGSRLQNMMVYAKEAVKKVAVADETLDVNRLAHKMTDDGQRVFSNEESAEDMHRTDKKISSMILLNICSMAGGSDLWHKSTSVAVPAADKFRDWKQEHGDSFLEVMTYSSASCFMKEKLGPAFQGNGHRMHAGKGPFELNFHHAEHEGYTQELEKTQGTLCMQADGEYFVVKQPDRVEIMHSQKINVLKPAHRRNEFVNEILGDGAQLLHFLEYAAAKGEHQSIAAAYATAILMGSGAIPSELDMDEMAWEAFGTLMTEYMATPGGREAHREWVEETAERIGRAISVDLRSKLKAYHDVGGEEVDEEHDLYAFACSVLRGLRLALQVEQRTLKALEGGAKTHHEDNVTEYASHCIQAWGGPNSDALKLQASFCRPLQLPRAGNFLSEPSEIPLLFDDIAPEAFRRIRALSGISEAEYFDSLCKEEVNLIAFGTNSKSGEFFFFSPDGLFMVKTVSASDAHALIDMLPRYEEHLRRYPQSLLCRYTGLHRTTLLCNDDSGVPKAMRSARWFVVIASVFSTCLGMHEKYDLKGSTLNRRELKEGQTHADADGSIPLKDLDWVARSEAVGPLQLSDEVRDSLLAQHQADTELLEEFGIMDYSVLLGVHDTQRASKGEAGAGCSFAAMPTKPAAATLLAVAKLKTLGRRAKSKENASKEQAEDSPKAPEEEQSPESSPTGLPKSRSSFHLGEAIESQDGRYLYFLGLIDTLGVYNLKKQAQDAAVSSFLTLKMDTKEASVAKPSHYRDRQIAFFRQVCGAPPEDPSKIQERRRSAVGGDLKAQFAARASQMSSSAQSMAQQATSSAQSMAQQAAVAAGPAARSAAENAALLGHQLGEGTAAAKQKVEAAAGVASDGLKRLTNMFNPKPRPK